MKTNHTTIINQLFFVIVVISITFYSCSVSQLTYTQKTYKETQKSDQIVQLNYSLPVITPTAKTTQEQTKGGVTISVEVIPFSTRIKQKEEETVTYKRPSQADYDVFEIKNTPYIAISPENINFKIRIRNREEVPLKLSEVGFALIIDGTQWSFPSTHLEEWNTGLILSGFEKEYIIKGPQLDGLGNAQVVYLFLNGVPVSYDKAGTVTKKSNYEWYFECKNETATKEAEITYAYESRPIHRERCAKCSGTGTDPKIYKCDKCDGNGAYINKYDGKTYKCNKCSGTGKIQLTCNDCSGNGVLVFPKSVYPPIDKTVTWYGWWVKVVTKPAGATIKVYNPDTGQYKDAGLASPCKVTWYYQSNLKEPIIIQQNGRQVKVLPYFEGNPSPSIIVDFTAGDPVVTKGQEIVD